MAEGSSPDVVDEKLFLGSLRASRAIKKSDYEKHVLIHASKLLKPIVLAMVIRNIRYLIHSLQFLF
jgi:hypothetical protein